MMKSLLLILSLAILTLPTASASEESRLYDKLLADAKSSRFAKLGKSEIGISCFFLDGIGRFIIHQKVVLKVDYDMQMMKEFIAGGTWSLVVFDKSTEVRKEARKAVDQEEARAFLSSIVGSEVFSLPAEVNAPSYVSTVGLDTPSYFFEKKEGSKKTVFVSRKGHLNGPADLAADAFIKLGGKQLTTVVNEVESHRRKP